MNTLFGCIEWDSCAPPEQDVQALDHALPAGPGTERAVWRGPGIVLGAHLVRTVPQSRDETSPLTSRDGRYVMVASARLDARPQLLVDLGLGPAHADASDSELLMFSYEQWGEAMVEHLYGDWACAVWDTCCRRLFLARDRHGVSALHYYRTSRRLVFATTLRALVNAPGIPRQPNPLRVAQFLITWAEHGPTTSYNDIFRLPPAHCLTVAATAPLQPPRRYWCLEHLLEPVDLPDAGAYVEAFLAHYRTAVSERLRTSGTLGITLSGGLDSGSIAALAGPVVQQRGGVLHAFTSVPLLQPYGDARTRFVDETDAARATAAFVPGIVWHRIDASANGVIDGIRNSLHMHAEPLRAAGSMYWLHAIFAAARAEGVDVLLTGQHGNPVVSWGGLVAGQGSWQHLRMSHAVQRLRALLLPLRMVLARAQIGPAPHWSGRTALHPLMEKRLRLRERVLAGSDAPSLQGCDAALRQRLALLKPGWSNLDSIWATTGSSYGIEVRDPTADVRLMLFCLGIPDAFFRGPPLDRRLLREAFAGLLPDTVRLETRRGLQASDQLQRLQQEAAAVELALAELEASPLAREWLDLPLMRQTWGRVQQGADRLTWIGSTHILLRGITVGQFLLQFE